jgi:hypothetical protein
MARIPGERECALPPTNVEMEVEFVERPDSAGSSTEMQETGIQPVNSATHFGK